MATPTELTPNSPEPGPPQPDQTTAEPPADDDTIDIHSFIVSLDPDIKGKFEPLSGLMLLNVSQDDYLAAFQKFGTHALMSEDDRDLIGTINHETYHGLQAVASGYFYDRQRRQFAVLDTPEPLPEIQIPPEVQANIDTMRRETGDDPDKKARTDRAEAVIRAEYTIRYFDSVAMPGDNSIFGALHPAFFRLQDQLAQEEAEPNSEGLSALDLLEGSAVAFAHQIMRPKGGAEQAMLADFANTPPQYRQFYDWTTQYVGSRAPSRAFELILPTTALALCYTQPNNAYGQLLEILAVSPTGQSIAAGQALMTNLPDIPAAGPILGTALDVRRRDPSYKMYDKFLDALESKRWPFNPYGLLADPANMNIIDTFPFSLVTNSDFHRLSSAMTLPELGARMLLCSLVLRKFSRRLEEMHIRDLEAAWMRDVLNNVMEGR